MNLKDKYKDLLSYLLDSDVDHVSIREDNNVLNVSGTAPSSVKDKLWEIYGKIDPDMRSGDLVMNIEAKQGGNNAGSEEYEVKSGDSLSKIAQNYPGMTWQKIYDANRDILSDPNKIMPGQKLKIPVNR